MLSKDALSGSGRHARERLSAGEVVLESVGAKSVGAAGATELYFERTEPAEQVIVFHHIQKTAGTSFRGFIAKNLRGCELESVDRLAAHSRRAELLAFYQDQYQSLAPDRRERLRCVASHTAGYLLPALDSRALAITLVRDPVERVLSHHYFRLKRQPRRRGLEQAYEVWGGNDPPDGSDALLKTAALFNWQARTLLAPWYDVSGLPFTTAASPGSKIWRRRLEKTVRRHYLVGAQENYAEFVRSIAEKLGWRPSIVHLKVNPERHAVTDVPSDLVERIRAYNWLDTELHERVLYGRRMRFLLRA